VQRFRVPDAAMLTGFAFVELGFTTMLRVAVKVPLQPVVLTTMVAEPAQSPLMVTVLPESVGAVP
jgi:hypothetical protein